MVVSNVPFTFNLRAWTGEWGQLYRGAQLDLCVVDNSPTATEIYSKVKQGGKFLYKRKKTFKTSSEDSQNVGGVSSEEDFDSDDDGAGHKKRPDAEPRMKHSEHSEKVRIENEGKKIHKTTTSVLGVAKYEIGQLVDKPNQEVEEVLPLARPKAWVVHGLPLTPQVMGLRRLDSRRTFQGRRLSRTDQRLTMYTPPHSHSVLVHHQRLSVYTTVCHTSIQPLR